MGFIKGFKTAAGVWFCLVLVTLLLVTLAPSVWAALTIRRFTLPPGEDLCVTCRGQRRGLWYLDVSPRRQVFKCARVRRAWQGVNEGCFHPDHQIDLSPGQALVVKPGGDKSRTLYCYTRGSHIGECWTN